MNTPKPSSAPFSDGKACVRTRFAPSPTGALHLGHAYAAQVAFENGDPMLLRFEDIDHTRTRSEYYERIESDLAWLGITYQPAPLRQSDRLPAYDDAIEKLKNQSAIYPCFCTRRQIAAELDRLGHAPQEGADGASNYPGICRRLVATEVAQRLKDKVPHAWRLDARALAAQLPALTFHDRCFGEIAVDPSRLGDVIIARRDIGTSYHLAVVVDDAFQKIDLVTRGEDLLDATHVHVALQHLLSLPTPRYLHHPLVRDAAGKRLATRDAATSLQTLRDKGLSAAEVLALAQARIVST